MQLKLFDFELAELAREGLPGPGDVAVDFGLDLGRLFAGPGAAESRTLHRAVPLDVLETNVNRWIAEQK